MAVAQRLLGVIRERRWQPLSRITASAGLAIAEPGRPTTRAELLIAADSGLHEAKSNGRDQVATYSGAGTGAFHWVDEIRAALEEDRLVLHAQPIVPLAGPGRRRQELLLRMVTRDGELVQPGAFIPAAEQFGLMHELDRWVVDGAIELARRGMEVEINLSGASLGDPEIRRRVEAEVADGLAPEMLTFEVTETTAARNIDAARDFAEELERLGCHFALDDFGTGFGSLIYLKHLPFSQLKIDIEFVREVTSSEASRRLIRAIVQMAAPLGLETVAEGVEDGETLALLRELGVDYAQGYFIARPAPVDASPDMGKANRRGGRRRRGVPERANGAPVPGAAD
jgi:EAL domain-containing protein (putative c-di-GMP-specific phosphodiesterase class I)